jgi:hypothetical protein
VGELKLPIQVIEERRALGQEIFERRSLLSIGLAHPLEGSKVGIFKIILPIIFIRPLPFSFDFEGLLGLGDDLLSLLLTHRFFTLLALSALLHLLEKRVLFHLLIDHVNEFQAGQLEKADRLLKLGGDHQLLNEFRCQLDL